MALILGIEKGQDFFIGDVQVIVTEIYSATHFRVTVIEENDEEHFEITDKMKVPVITKQAYCPEKRTMVEKVVASIQAGSRGGRDLARVAIEAPRSVEILRGELYRRTVSGDYELSYSAKKDAERLFKDVNEPAILEMVRQSAKVTHPFGNRRYEDYVFKMDGKKVEGIGLFAGGSGNGTGKQRGEGDGRSTYYDDCPRCDGMGCDHCDDGLVVIKNS